MQLRHVSAYLFKSMRRGYNSGLSAGGQPIPHPLFASTCHQPVQGAHQLVAVAGVVQEGGNPNSRGPGLSGKSHVLAVAIDPNGIGKIAMEVRVGHHVTIGGTGMGKVAEVGMVRQIERYSLYFRRLAHAVIIRYNGVNGAR